MLWFYSYKNSRLEILNELEELLQHGTRHYSLKVNTNHSMKKEIGSIPVPNDIIHQLREVKRAKKSEEFRRYHYARTSIMGNLCAEFSELNMVPYGEDPYDYISPEYRELFEL